MTEADLRYQIEQLRRSLETEKAIVQHLENLILRMQPPRPAFDPSTFPWRGQTQW